MKDYDPACEDLAEMFLDDPPQRALLEARGYDVNQLDGLRRQLAQHIQEAVEDWFSLLEDETGERHGD
jgi:hypothetical protein